MVGCDTSQCGACTVLPRWPRREVVHVPHGDARRPLRSPPIEGIARPGRAAASDATRVPGAPRPAVRATARPEWSSARSRSCAASASPAEHDVREALEGNLCRCTGYQGIVEAVLEGAAAMQRAAGCMSSRLHRPATVDEAVAAHGRAQDPLYLAGGQTLIPSLKLRLARPSECRRYHVDRCAQGHRRTARGALGSGRSRRMRASRNPRSCAPGCPRSRAWRWRIGDQMVRNRGTLGGAIANNDPIGDYPAAALGLGATIRPSAGRSQPTSSSVARSRAHSLSAVS